MNACKYACKDASLHACMHGCMHGCMHECMHGCIHEVQARVIKAKDTSSTPWGIPGYPTDDTQTARGSGGGSPRKNAPRAKALSKIHPNCFLNILVFLINHKYRKKNSKFSPGVIPPEIFFNLSWGRQNLSFIGLKFNGFMMIFQFNFGARGPLYTPYIPLLKTAVKFRRGL